MEHPLSLPVLMRLYIISQQFFAGYRSAIHLLHFERKKNNKSKINIHTVSQSRSVSHPGISTQCTDQEVTFLSVSGRGIGLKRIPAHRWRRAAAPTAPQVLFVQADSDDAPPLQASLPWKPLFISPFDARLAAAHTQIYMHILMLLKQRVMKILPEAQAEEL